MSTPAKLSLLFSLCYAVSAPELVVATDALIADFEDSELNDWTIEGSAFGSQPARGALEGQMHVEGFLGKGFLNSFHGGDKTVGSATSPAFTVSRDYLTFLIGGGRHPGRVGVELMLSGNVVRATTGRDSEHLAWHSWDVKDLRGQSVRLRAFDRHTGGWGHILVDHIALADEPKREPSLGERLKDYRASSGYYREAFRPQFHFTPEVNWMNDPNGLVYYDGEYHLFYQYNPFGNRWGHMSWGHAVSTDLVHWQHLPVALYEEEQDGRGNVMIFSGCAVVDWNNTSGFGKDGKPPLVALYSGHSSDKQTQDIAYSNDRGRTWTKYVGNPVIDVGERDFRDPKVFWHKPTERWIMVVSLALQKRVSFYASTNLKDWTLLSHFGPAGAKDVPNWECPDLFELPIEGSDKTRWVLEIDVGGGSVAGGSGGQYFVGSFDGTSFTNDNPADTVLWVDYGRDFYAPVSFSDIPESDGRRIWLGWINNWETHLLPTKPWRSAQSIPRTVGLRRFPAGVRLVQKPVKELRQLRDESRAGSVHFDDVSLTECQDLLTNEGQKWGATFEIDVTFQLGDSDEFGVRIRSSENVYTTVGYDPEKQELFVNRRHSGVVDFHPAFAGIHRAPLAPHNGTVRLHMFVDTSVVEVFAGRGSVVITDRIFPDPSTKGFELYERGGSTLVGSLKAWKLKSVWHK